MRRKLTITQATQRVLTRRLSDAFLFAISAFEIESVMSGSVKVGSLVRAGCGECEWCDDTIPTS
eukprot:1319141-Amorphochlora_amoeboformis.AAC.1